MAPIPTPAGFAQGFLSNPVRSLWKCEIEALFAAVTINPKAPMSSTVYAYCVLTVQALLERGDAAVDDAFEELATARAYIGLYKRRQKWRRGGYEAGVDYDAVVRVFGPHATAKAPSVQHIFECRRHAHVIAAGFASARAGPVILESHDECPMPWANGFACFKRKNLDRYRDNSDGRYDGAARAAKRIRVESARNGLAGWSTMAQTGAAQFHLEMAYDNFGCGFQGDPQLTLASLTEAGMGTHDEREKGVKLAEAAGKERRLEDECELALLTGDEKDFDPEQLEEEVNFWRDF
ncbi:hypothetical protein D7B24_003514 [Verticillium nonalfalfae]|uniref:Uncharacterized protein n=1 Tax=Verticillium nonalfalfae TaxID=1051616 RepID=A0A3M9YM26_9PEZI|nr:uncharacterized protein D7B24_003514 [Verticillium nonalfalfae]RNJ61101.1 hypothetical protein D7B24_003514 [Verticillium nonalfalfae]